MGPNRYIHAYNSLELIEYCLYFNTLNKEVEVCQLVYLLQNMPYMTKSLKKLAAIFVSEEHL